MHAYKVRAYKVYARKIYLTGVYFTGVHLTGVQAFYRRASILQACKHFTGVQAYLIAEVINSRSYLPRVVPIVLLTESST
jgi:hypothetical protein